MKLHVFNDAHGFISDLTVKRILAMDPAGDHQFINLTATTIFKHDRMLYLTRNMGAYKKAIKQLPPISCIIFYPLDYIASQFSKLFQQQQPNVQTIWVFWSYEYYHRPDRIMENFGPYSTSYLNSKKGLLQLGKQAFGAVLKKLAGRPYFQPDICNASYQQVSIFYSFLPRDYRNVFSSVPGNQFRYKPISFLDIEEITKGLPAEPGTLTPEIMVGHSASPSINHYEILQELNHTGVTQPIFIPLEYGDEDYGRRIKSAAKKLFPQQQLSFLEQRLSMQDYYQRLSTVGFAVFNFRWQEALGNILFLLWNGTKVFLRKESSVYIQFEQWGCHIFPVEGSLSASSLSTALSPAQRSDNRRIVEELFNEDQVAQYWKDLIHI
jgi:dTDP-N-acetylfucosamine:lipid II N-acetylfucosaminyltransferase